MTEAAGGAAGDAAGEASADAGGRTSPLGRRSRHDRPVDERAEALKERVYATFTGLAIVLVQQTNVEHITAARATLTLLVGIVAISAAGFVADVIAHLAVHAAFPDRAELGRMLRTAGSAVGSASVPLLVLALAALGVFELEGALRAASIVYLVTLGLLGYVAVRRTRVAWWKQLLALGALVALGLAVVGLQQLAHGH
ncbi:hypothetical protein EDM22_02975 [Agromyces tardus]|uniref:Uncharacterized protein n=1 Tax=Agromyces tardus TaxID=2583849 RepID=A0A3M8AL42_9MICO|nr:hypothetical protein [Agromyces tardus]RNB51918.1 hypothetical protein EDM22_02975 [Agromyces tardus]